jgi:hypothetical protein
MTDMRHNTTEKSLPHSRGGARSRRRVILLLLQRLVNFRAVIETRRDRVWEILARVMVVKTSES